MDDFETFKPSKKRKSKKRCSNDREDFISMFSDLFHSINYKVAILLFILGILIFSDTFIELFLTPIDGAVQGDEATTKGTLIQLIFLTLGYIVADLLVTGEIL